MTVPDRRRLSDEDIEALADAVMRRRAHVCRFQELKPEDVRRAIALERHVSGVVKETNSVIRKTIISGGIGLLFVLLGLGIIAKFKELLKIGVGN